MQEMWAEDLVYNNEYNWSSNYMDEFKEYVDTPKKERDICSEWVLTRDKLPEYGVSVEVMSYFMGTLEKKVGKLVTRDSIIEGCKFNKWVDDKDVWIREVSRWRSI